MSRITRQMLQLIGQPFTVRMDRAKHELGYVPRVSWKQGIDEMSGRPIGPSIGTAPKTRIVAMDMASASHRSTPLAA